MKSKWNCLIVLLMFFTSSCSSNAKLAAGWITVGVLAVPGVPIAKAINTVKSSNSRASQERLSEMFDPVYRERIDIISKRDSTADANNIFNNGAIAYFPYDLSQHPGSKKFTGHSQFPGRSLGQDANIDDEKNFAVLHEDELLKYLVALMSKDPLHESEQGYYYSKTYIEFLQTCAKYKESFNETMFDKYNQSKIAN